MPQVKTLIISTIDYSKAAFSTTKFFEVHNKFCLLFVREAVII